MVSVNEVAPSGARDQLKETQLHFEDEREVVSTSVVKVTELSQEVVEPKRDNEKLVGRNTDLDRDLENV